MSQRNPHSPLTDEHLSQLRSAEKLMAAAEAQIQLASQAGIDVKHHQDEVTKQKAQIRAIKNTYFPGE